jgi:hypothetical protein
VNTTQEQLKQFEELNHFGTPLDEWVLEHTKLTSRRLAITQTGNCLENVVYAQAWDGMSVMMSLELENISTKVVRIDAIRLEMPWPEADFQWFSKLSGRALRERGYALPAPGPEGFEASAILNHRMGGNFRLNPLDPVEGYLIGSGSSMIPSDYPDGTKLPMRLVIFCGNGERFEHWVKLSVHRDVARSPKRSTRRAPLFSRPDNQPLLDSVGARL